MAKEWTELQAAFVRNVQRIEKNKGVNPANDGPEVEVIRFFSRFPNGANCCCGSRSLCGKRLQGG